MNYYTHVFDCLVSDLQVNVYLLKTEFKLSKINIIEHVEREVVTIAICCGENKWKKILEKVYQV